MPSPDPNNPQPTPDNPNPEPVRPPSPPEEPPTREPPGVPSPSPDPVPSPDEPVQIPPGTPPEIPPQPPQPGFPAPTARARASLARVSGGFALALFLSLLVHAGQVAAQTPGGDGTAQADPCQAEPQEDQQHNSAGSNDELSEKLENCRGVLKPPPTGDQEIAEPPPDAGTTPVIPPGNVPEQPAK
jgi:hypothetical protein